MSWSQTYIQCQRNGDHGEVEAEQYVVFGETIGDELGTDEVDKVEVETHVDNGNDGLLAAVPYIIDADVSLTDLKPGRDPDTEDADVDGQHQSEDGPFQGSRLLLSDHEECDSVDDDLHDTLDLHDPKTKQEEDEPKALRR